MSLLQLPSEVLREVFHHIGSSFFQEDTSRLTISKRWYEYAYSACFETASLTQESLDRMLASPYPPHLDDHLRALNLDLRGFKPASWEAATSSQDATLLKHHDDAPPSKEDVPAKPYLAWMKSQDKKLLQLAEAMRKCRKLRAIYIHVWRSAQKNDALDTIFDYGYLYTSTVQSLVTMDHLNALVLDMPTGFRAETPEQLDCHICPVIARHIPTLTLLHVRLRYICPDILKSPDEEDKEPRSLRLRSLIVNLGMWPEMPWSPIACHSKPCGGALDPRVGVQTLREAVRLRAERLVDRMEHDDKKVRILNYRLPNFEIESYDVLTGKTMLLDDDSQWHADGRVVSDGVRG